MTKLADLPKGVCPGCEKPIAEGEQHPIAVDSTRYGKTYAITIDTHPTDKCIDEGRRVAMADSSWKTNESYRAD